MVLLRKIRRRAFDVIAPRWMELRNRFSRRAVVGDVPVVVSLTTHGTRYSRVHLTIEAIARSQGRPSRFILWLDDDALLANPTPQVQRLQARGLEVLKATNYRPHTKYFPYVESTSHHELPLVTADDDIFYPRDWLSGLYAAHRQTPDVVVCYRSRVMSLAGDGLAPYASWPVATSAEAATNHMALGVSGVLYPPSMLDALNSEGTAFVPLTLPADDIWLHAVALRSGHKVRQIANHGPHFPLFAHAPESALSQSNQVDGANDTYIRNVYGASEVQLLRSALGEGNR